MPHPHGAYDNLTSRGLTTSLLAIVACLASLSAQAQTPPVAAQGANLSGRWTLDREHSDFPKEVGFGVPWMPTGTATDAPPQGGGGRGGGGRGRGGGGGAGGRGVGTAFNPRVESADDARRREMLTAQIRSPSGTLTIVDSADSVVLTDDQNQVVTLHPDGRAESLQLNGVSLLTTSRRENGRLSVLYAVEDLRQLRYTFSRTISPDQLLVEIEFVEKGVKGDTLRRLYAPATNGTTAPGVAATASAALAPNGSQGDRRATPPPGNAAPPVRRPGSEFSGLRKIGVVVEELTSMAAGCGLKREEIESAVTKRFSDAGLSVRRDSDEDTYVYVSVMTSSLPTGMCISRYDWSIYSNTQATLSYQQEPVLAQVMLAHKGGLTGSGSATHAADVQRGLDDGLAQIATRIQADNK